jgi:hypothetical protein
MGNSPTNEVDPTGLRVYLPDYDSGTQRSSAAELFYQFLKDSYQAVLKADPKTTLPVFPTAILIEQIHTYKKTDGPYWLKTIRGRVDLSNIPKETLDAILKWNDENGNKQMSNLIRAALDPGSNVQLTRSGNVLRYGSWVLHRETDGGVLENALQMVGLAGTLEGRHALAESIAIGAEFLNGEAHTFAREVMNQYPASKGYTDDLRTWIQEAARHYYWQMMLTIRFGPDVAKAIGDWHETDLSLNPKPISLDTILDQHHNKMAREAAAPLRAEFLKAVDAHRKAMPLQFSENSGETMEWDKNRTKYSSLVKEYILKLIDEAVRRKNVDNKVIIYPEDPFITEGLGLPLTIRPGQGRPGWPPTPTKP